MNNKERAESILKSHSNNFNEIKNEKDFDKSVSKTLENIIPIGNKIGALALTAVIAFSSFAPQTLEAAQSKSIGDNISQDFDRFIQKSIKKAERIHKSDTKKLKRLAKKLNKQCSADEKKYEEYQAKKAEGKLSSLEESRIKHKESSIVKRFIHNEKLQEATEQALKDKGVMTINLHFGKDKCDTTRLVDIANEYKTKKDNQNSFLNKATEKASDTYENAKNSEIGKSVAKNTSEAADQVKKDFSELGEKVSSGFSSFMKNFKANKNTPEDDNNNDNGFGF